MAPSVRYKPTWAYIVSNVISPPVVFSLLALAMAAYFPANGRFSTLFFALVFIGINIMIPLGFLIWLLRKGRITDIHTPKSTERRLPILVSSVCAVATLFIYLLTEAPPAFVFLGLFAALSNILVGIITFFSHISVHAAVISGTLSIIWLIISPVIALLLTPAAGLVIAARLALKRHHVNQIVTGVLLGMISAALCYALVYR